MKDSDSPDQTPPSPPSPPDDGAPTDGPAAEGPDAAQRRLLTAAVRHSRLPLKDLWLHYFSIGGTAGEYELDAYINASYFLPTVQHDILAQAVNEMIDMLPPSPRAPFSTNAVDGGTPGTLEE